jgi:hypothetical protein
MTDKRLFLAVPHYGELAPEAVISLLQPTYEHKIKIQTNCASLLAHNFNRLWCSALNQRAEQGITHFAMHHADIQSRAGWLDILLMELERVSADVLSCVVPLKDQRGLTSTAVYDSVAGRIRRLTMKEVFRLPVTFGIHNLPEHMRTFEGSPTAFADTLLVNTGLWVCDFTRPWVEKFPGFNIQDNVCKEGDGKYRAAVFSEDWNFSRWCAQHGARVLATRLVPVTHWGRTAFSTSEPWGTWDTDRPDPE